MYELINERRDKEIHRKEKRDMKDYLGNLPGLDQIGSVRQSHKRSFGQRFH